MSTLSTGVVRHYLKNGELDKLFIEELGWDQHTGTLEIPIDGQTYKLRGFAEKRGVQIFECQPNGEGKIPDYQTRRKIEKQVTKSAYEHLIVFIDGDKNTQIWQWVARQPGTPAAFREHHYQPQHQSGDALIQKLSAISIPLDEEEALDLTGTVHKLRDAFDRDRITKKFYDHFKREHGAFLEFIKGVTEKGDQEWYASLMLNRLMFVYFIQKKGFLDGNLNYLQDRLGQVQSRKGKGKFLSFYQYFLLCLFHEGFSTQPKHRTLDPELKALIGEVPYLNGGLFDVHEIEEKYPELDVPDEAFEKLFAFFDQYEWHLDTRPLSNDNEINPDVLGYIFEKYINQKQMGAYYTKEDITEYISKNTIVPYLFDAARKNCAVAFESGSAVWQMLAEDPDRYIYPAVRKGVIDEHGEVIPLPKKIAAGIKDVKKRVDWNRLADEDFALPTETWREHVARRQRCLELREKLSTGDVHEINDLVTYNLDIRQLAEDVIVGCEGPDLLRAMYKAISTATVLDPACGSGAFLFAALEILEPLYEACLERMRGFVDDLDRSGQKRDGRIFSDFRKILDDVYNPNKHANPAYFTLKSIIVNNLYGVDIMEAAVEICKLRLFLKLVAQVDKVKELEPLPDIDFNIRPGNTLVGFAKLDEVRSSLKGTLGFAKDEVDDIVEEAEIVERAFQKFHEMQTQHGMDPRGFVAQKQELRVRLNQLSNKLDHFLAGDYGISGSQTQSLVDWSKTHEPFHWFAEFYGIMHDGGFGVIIGNPPYVSASKTRKSYTVQRFETAKCPDIYAWFLERAVVLLRNNGRSGMIVPLSLTFSRDFAPLRNTLISQYRANWFSSFGRIPSALFNYDVRVRNTIHLGSKASGDPRNFTSRLHRWFDSERPHLFGALGYAPFTPKSWKGLIPKLDSPRLAERLETLLNSPVTRLSAFVLERPIAGPKLYFKKTAYNWLAFSHIPPPCFDESGRAIPQSQLDVLSIAESGDDAPLFLLLNGKLSFLFWFIAGDDFHVTKRVLTEIPAPIQDLSQAMHDQMADLAVALEKAMGESVSFKLNAGKRVGNYNLAKCRQATDTSDLLFAPLLGLNDIWDDIELFYAKAVKTDFH